MSALPPKALKHIYDHKGTKPYRKGRYGREGISEVFRENSLMLHGRGNIFGVLRSALWSFAEEGMVPALRSELVTFL